MDLKRSGRSKNKGWMWTTVIVQIWNSAFHCKRSDPSEPSILFLSHHQATQGRRSAALSFLLVRGVGPDTVAVARSILNSVFFTKDLSLGFTKIHVLDPDTCQVNFALLESREMNYGQSGATEGSGVGWETIPQSFQSILSTWGGWGGGWCRVVGRGQVGSLHDCFKAIHTVFLQDPFYPESPIGRIRGAHCSLLLHRPPPCGTQKAPEEEER